MINNSDQEYDLIHGDAVTASISLLDELGEKLFTALRNIVKIRPHRLFFLIKVNYFDRARHLFHVWLQLPSWKDRVFFTKFIQLWRCSMQFRVVTSTLMLSAAVMMILAFVLMSQVISHVLNSRIAMARDELNRERVNVEENLSSTLSKTEEYRLSNALRALNAFTGQIGENPGSFDHQTVLVPKDRDKSVGPLEKVPLELIDYVSRTSLVSYQYSTDRNVFSSHSLIIGAPINSDIEGLSIYLIYSLKESADTVRLVQNTLIFGACFLVATLALIAYIVSRQVVLPVRLAAQSAVSFASGHFDERIAVRGEDDMARLASAFNEMAENLSQQINQLEEYGNLQRRFTSDVSHELRTPLTTIRMAADVLYDYKDELNNPIILRSTELLMTEVDRFENLLKDLLEISRHDAGVAELSVELIDLSFPIRHSVAVLEQLAESAHTEIRLDLPDEPIEAEVDQRRVERIIRNLIANAIDHSEGKPIDIQMRANSTTVAIVVRDYGVGLKSGQENLVFSRFWRADASRFRRSGGTGLGLAISLEDAKLHNGYLTAWGKPGNGASFCLILPLYARNQIVDIPQLSYPLGKISSVSGFHALTSQGKVSAVHESIMDDR